MKMVLDSLAFIASSPCSPLNHHFLYASRGLETSSSVRPRVFTDVAETATSEDRLADVSTGRLRQTPLRATPRSARVPPPRAQGRPLPIP
ncbi:hypothetical protein NL676_027073 [Syzygium grande]|nr:hypothetical protein NL676_027073 [Syzygium grande]